MTYKGQYYNNFMQRCINFKNRKHSLFDWEPQKSIRPRVSLGDQFLPSKFSISVLAHLFFATIS